MNLVPNASPDTIRHCPDIGRELDTHPPLVARLLCTLPGAVLNAPVPTRTAAEPLTELDGSPCSGMSPLLLSKTRSQHCCVMACSH
jgi:hypothetical protein